MACPIPLSALSEALRKHADPKAPAPLRLMASRGMVPMPPRDMVTALAMLSYDEDEKIQGGAIKTLAELPERVVLSALGEQLHPLVLDQLARNFSENETALETILLNKDTPDETFAYLADSVGERLLGIVVENQVRLLRHPPITEALLKNPAILKSQVDRVMDFAVRTGMDFKGLDAFEEAKQRILTGPRNVEEERRVQKIVIESLPEDLMREEEEPEPTNAEEAEEQNRKRETMLQRLGHMTAAQKVALAQKGNKVVRMQLVRDSNRVVAVAAIRNPGINESEILSVASNRGVCDDVIRIIAQNREWTRSYQVKLALVTNPKTPLATSMRFLTALRANDLKSLANNKNVPSALATTAKAMISRRNQK